MVVQRVSPEVRKTAPGLRGYPIIGCFLQMSQNPIQFLTGVVREYGGVVHLGAMGFQQLYLVVQPEQVKYILQDNYQNYTKGENFKEIKRVIGDGLVISEGDVWRRQRRLMQPSFHRQRIYALVNVMTAVISEMLERWRNIERGVALNVSTEMMQLTQKIVLKALLSVESIDDTDKLIRSWNIVYKFLSDRMWALFKLPVGLPTPQNLEFKQAVHTLDKIVYRIIRERQQQTSDDRDDVLSMLLNTRDECGERMSDEQLHDEIMTIFSAGFETSAAVLAWIWYLLSQHPSVEQKLHAELATVLGGRTPTIEDLPKLKYTKMVVEESMRLYPGAWVFTRNSIADDEIGGYRIPAKSMILLSPFVTHRLPTLWEKPDHFYPEHFSSENSAGRPRYAYYPFGGGPRQCLGDVFAMTEIQLVVAMVAQRYRLQLVPEHPVEMKPLLTLQARHDILMTLEARSGF